MMTQGHLRAPECLAWSPDGKLIASGAGDMTARIWDANTGVELQTLRGHRGDVTAACFVASGKQLITSARDQTLRLWDVASGRELAVFSGQQAPITGMAATKDGKVALWAAMPQAPQIQIVDPGSGEKVKSISVHERSLSRLAFVPSRCYRRCYERSRRRRPYLESDDRRACGRTTRPHRQ